MAYIKIKIPSETSGWNLDAWQFNPQARGSHPVIIMAHGFGATKELGLSHFAKRFADEGYAAVVFDYRHWGDSDGAPRNYLVANKQIEDYKTVLKYVRQQAEFDSNKIILWGSSFSGGHVLQLSAENPGIVATIAQGPFTSGLASAFHLPRINLLKVTAYALVGTIKEAMGGSPIYIPTAGNPEEFAAMNTTDVRPGFEMIKPAEMDTDSYSNYLNASVFLTLPSYNPIWSAGKIKSPLLLVVPEVDSLCPVGATLQGVKAIPDIQVVRVAGGHFDVYKGGRGFHKNIAEQIKFLKRVVPT